MRKYIEFIFAEYTRHFSCINLLRELEHNVGMNLSLSDVAKLMPNLLNDDYFMSMLVRRDFSHHKHEVKYDKECHKKLLNMEKASRMYGKYFIQHETLEMRMMQTSSERMTPC